MFDWRHTGQSTAAATIRVSVLALMLASLPACASSSDDSAPASTEASATVGSTASIAQSGSPQSSATDLQDTKWQLSAASLSSVDLAKYEITIEFAVDKVSGFAGVNRYTGSFETEPDGSIKFGPLATTKMAGTPEAMAAESAYLKALQAVSRYSAGKTDLSLVNPDGVTLEYKVAK